MLRGGHEIEFDGAAPGGTVVDCVVCDALARIEGDRCVGLADRRDEFERAAGEIVAAHRRCKSRIHEWHELSPGGWRCECNHRIDRREWCETRIGVLIRSLWHRQDGREMHDTAEQN